MQNNHELTDEFIAFYRDYYREEIGTLAQRYPKEQTDLEISYGKLHTFNPDLAEDWLKHPEQVNGYADEALSLFDLPADVDLSGAHVRLSDLNEEDVVSPLEATKEAPDREENYFGIRGELAKVSTPMPEIQEAAYECQRCSTMTYIPQSGNSLEEPHECQGCERQGPFRINFDKSEFEHHARIRVETPPDQRGDLQREYIDGDVRGSLVWSGGEEFGIAERSGDSVTVYGTLEKEQVMDGKKKTRLFEDYFNVHAISYESDDDNVDIEAHRAEFESFAERSDAVDVYAQSLVPELHATPEWETALELLVAYLFGAPRIDVPGGPTYRGDIHVLIISGFGMGKSIVNSAIANYSPKSIKEAATGMSSDVSLLAAAVEDDFGSGGWTLKPGILARANGGHVILDEIDKTDADLERMNNALEGEQVVDVNKAGQQATFKSRVGLLATGNPEGSRFTNEPIAEQLNIDQSLLSRFDGIVTMIDESDPEQDFDIAETIGNSMLEAIEWEFGGREEFDELSRDVTPEVGRAWIAYARENVHPVPTKEQIQRISEWYATEVRQLNNDFSGGSNSGDMPVPVSARTVADTIRAAVAFARVNLSDEVRDEHIDRAMKLQKTLIGQTFDGEKFVPQESRKSLDTEQKKRDALKDIIRDLEGDDPAQEDEVLTEAMDQHGMNPSTVEDNIEYLRRKGEVYQPQGYDTYRVS